MSASFALTGAGIPAPRRRTFTAALHAFAHSELTALRHPCLRWSATPTPGVRGSRRLPHWMTEDSIHSTRKARGCPCPGSRAWRQAEPWMAERSRHAVSGGLAPIRRGRIGQGRSERPATGYGQPRAGWASGRSTPVRRQRKKPAALSRRGLEMWRRADFSAPSFAAEPGPPYRTASCSIFAFGTECRWSMPFSRVSITVATGPTSRTVPSRPATLTVSPVWRRCRT